jgi:hypothetical protein
MPDIVFGTADASFGLPVTFFGTADVNFGLPITVFGWFRDILQGFF